MPALVPSKATHPRATTPAGGMLPSALRGKLPPAVAASAQQEYGNFRSYYAYACLPVDAYSLHLYDSYGDGWDGGRLSLTQMLNATSGCALLSETTSGASRSLDFAITVRRQCAFVLVV
jgi:hypothetical protein